MSEYTKDFYANITGVTGEETVYLEFFDNVLTLVTKEKDYFNLYIINQNFKVEPINNLWEQIPLENAPENWHFYLELRSIEHDLWHRYDKSFSITCEDI